MGGEGCEGEGEGNEFSECTEGGSDLSGKVRRGEERTNEGFDGEVRERERRERCRTFYS